MSSDTAELDESQLTAEARQFAVRLFQRFPELRRHAAMERVPGQPTWTLVVTVPAPSGDVRCQLVIWVDNGDEPSVAFGSWHTHERVWGDECEDGESHGAILALVDGIFAERYVLCEDAQGAAAVGSTTILDLTVGDALLDELTSEYSPSCVRLRSWAGTQDRTVHLDSLESEGSA